MLQIVQLKSTFFILILCSKLFGVFEADGFYNPFLHKDETKELKELCNKEDAKSCFLLAFIYEDGDNVVRDYAKAAQFYAKSCELDFAKACNNLAILYQNGFGVMKDFIQAAKFYQKACNLGFDLSCLNLTGFEVIYR